MAFHAWKRKLRDFVNWVLAFIICNWNMESKASLANPPCPVDLPELISSSWRSIFLVGFGFISRDTGPVSVRVADGIRGL